MAGRKDVDRPFPCVRAVDPGRVDEVRVHPLERGQEDHDHEAERRPHGGGEHRHEGGVLVAEPTGRKGSEPDCLQHLVERAEQGVVDPAPDRPDDDDGQDEGQKVDDAKRRSSADIARQGDGQRQPDDDRGGRADDRPDQVVRQRGPELGVLEQDHVVGQPDEVHDRLVAIPGRQAQPDRAQEGHGHEQHVHDQRWQQEERHEGQRRPSSSPFAHSPGTAPGQRPGTECHAQISAAGRASRRRPTTASGSYPPSRWRPCRQPRACRPSVGG